MDMFSYLLGRSSGGGGKGGLKVAIVEELPETGEANTLYLVPRQISKYRNVFDEYLYIDSDWEMVGTTDIDISGKQDKMQFDTMPTASSSNVGKIVQYIGTTNANYTNGYFYICLSDGGDPATYSWENVEVQPNDGGDKFYLGNTSDYTANNRLDITNLPKGIYALYNYYGETLYIKATINGQEVIGNCYPNGQSPVNKELILEIKTPLNEEITSGTYIGTFNWGYVNDSTRVIEFHSTTIRYNGTSNFDTSSGTSNIFNVITTSGSQTITGRKTFSTLPESSVTPTTDYQLVNKKYVDDNAGGSSGVVVTDSNKTDSDILAKLNEEYNKYLNNEAYNIYYEMSLRSGTYRVPIYINKISGNYGFCDSCFIGTQRQAGGQKWFYVDVLMQLTNNEITSFTPAIKDYSDNILFKDNTKGYNVTNDTQPAHKLYVDTAISNAIGDINTVLATLTTPSNNGGN